MNDPNWIELASAIGSLLSVTGLFAAAAGLFYLARQARTNERATIAAVYQSIVAFGNELNDMFVERPELYEKIFGVTSTLSDTTFDDPQRFFAAQKWLDYFETILVSWSSIPENLHRPWLEYIKSYLADSPLLQSIVLESQWYGDDLKSICVEAISTKP